MNYTEDNFDWSKPIEKKDSRLTIILAIVVFALLFAVISLL